jgi:nucleoside-diphosphate-sugar epimerase
VNDKPVLVTGATGCLGGHLTRRLVEDGHHVVVFKRHTQHLGPIADLARDVELRLGDVTDPAGVHAAMRGVGTVYHLAGIVAPFNRLSEQMWQVNVVGSMHVGSAALAAKVDRMVHTSSVAAIGYPPDGFVADESFPFAESVAANGYSTTKHHGEQAVLGLAKAGLDVVSVNPSAVMAAGGDLRYSWSALVNATLRGRLKVVPPGGTAVCTAHDFVDGHLKAMSSGVAGERYILSSANLSYRELLGMVAEAGGVRAPRLRVPAPLLRAAGAVVAPVAARVIRDPYSTPVVVPENVELMTRQLYYDQTRAVKELGLDQTAVEKAVADMVAWCRQPDGGGR